MNITKFCNAFNDSRQECHEDYSVTLHDIKVLFPTADMTASKYGSDQALDCHDDLELMSAELDAAEEECRKENPSIKFWRDGGWH